MEERKEVRIPLPCRFGEKAECRGKMLPLEGVYWFKWSRGTEYTYFFGVPGCWHNAEFYTTFETDQPCRFNIPEKLLLDRKIKEHGYPLRGSGYADGVRYIEGKTYVDFIMTSSYFAHIQVQCDNSGMYVPDGSIIFPPSWDTEEKKERAVLKTKLKSNELEKGRTIEPKMKQFSIFDFIS